MTDKRGAALWLSLTKPMWRASKDELLARAAG